MKYALRTLWHDRGFAAMAVLSLMIGIGANTAIFSLVSGVLLRPLDFPDPARLVVHRDFDAAIPQRGCVADQSRATGGMAQADAFVRGHRRLSQYHGESHGRRPSRVDSGGAGFGESLRCTGRASAFRPHVSRAGGQLRPAPGGDAGGFDLEATVRRRCFDRGAQDHAGGRAVYGGGRSAAGFRIPEAARRYGQAPERTHGDFRPLGYRPNRLCRTTAI